MVVRQSIDNELDVLAPPRRRYVPLETKRAVRGRDGNCCRQCGAIDGPLHIDHIFPWSKGGSNDLDNVQVLCAACNLRESAQIAGDEPVVPVIAELIDVARLAGAAVPHTISDLGKVVRACVANDQSDAALCLAWVLDVHPDTTTAMRASVGEALNGVGENWQRRSSCSSC